jgi:hypothetical protein
VFEVLGGPAIRLFTVALQVATQKVLKLVDLLKKIPRLETLFEFPEFDVKGATENLRKQISESLVQGVTDATKKIRGLPKAIGPAISALPEDSDAALKFFESFSGTTLERASKWIAFWKESKKGATDYVNALNAVKFASADLAQVGDLPGIFAQMDRLNSIIEELDRNIRSTQSLPEQLAFAEAQQDARDLIAELDKGLRKRSLFDENAILADFDVFIVKAKELQLGLAEAFDLTKNSRFQNFKAEYKDALESAPPAAAAALERAFTRIRPEFIFERLGHRLEQFTEQYEKALASDTPIQDLKKLRDAFVQFVDVTLRPQIDVNDAEAMATLGHVIEFGEGLFGPPLVLKIEAELDREAIESARSTLGDLRAVLEGEGVDADFLSRKSLNGLKTMKELIPVIEQGLRTLFEVGDPQQQVERYKNVREALLGLKFGSKEATEAFQSLLNPVLVQTNKLLREAVVAAGGLRVLEKLREQLSLRIELKSELDEQGLAKLRQDVLAFAADVDLFPERLDLQVDAKAFLDSTDPVKADLQKLHELGRRIQILVQLERGREAAQGLRELKALTADYPLDLEIRLLIVNLEKSIDRLNDTPGRFEAAARRTAESARRSLEALPFDGISDAVDRAFSSGIKKARLGSDAIQEVVAEMVVAIIAQMTRLAVAMVFLQSFAGPTGAANIIIPDPTWRKAGGGTTDDPGKAGEDAGRNWSTGFEFGTAAIAPLRIPVVSSFQLATERFASALFPQATAVTPTNIYVTAVDAKGVEESLRFGPLGKAFDKVVRRGF